MYPKIYLAIDNCVCYKRYTRPMEWAKVIADMGITQVEASADTELDPLYTGEEHLSRWLDEVREMQIRTGVRVANLYSGHGSYTTLGMAHPEASVRAQMVNGFFKPMVRMAGALGCGMGFFAHAFENSALQNSESYNRYIGYVEDALVEINSYAAEVGCGDLGIEKMYTPHQYPWRNADVKALLRNVTRRSGRDFYVTEDVGHHAPKFVRPRREQLLNGRGRDVWLGSDRAFALYEEKGIAAWPEIEEDIAANPQLFMEDAEGGAYESLRDIGAYSPIVHLQQTHGALSAHLPFIPEENAKGIITGERVLRALKESYDKPVEEGMPARCKNLYLTLEIFSGTTSIMFDVLKDCRTSAEYWRRFIPEDGMPLDALVARL